MESLVSKDLLFKHSTTKYSIILKSSIIRILYFFTLLLFYYYFYLYYIFYFIIILFLNCYDKREKDYDESNDKNMSLYFEIYMVLEERLRRFEKQIEQHNLKD